MTLIDLAWAWGLDGLRPAEKLVLLGLTDGMPAHRIAKWAGLSNVETAKVMAGLIERGHLDAAGRPNPPKHESFAAPLYEKRKLRDSLRRAVFERDGYRCRECGTDERLSVDHIYPEVKGGSDDLDNLQTLCVSCNRLKGARV